MNDRRERNKMHEIEGKENSVRRWKGGSEGKQSDEGGGGGDKAGGIKRRKEGE